MFLVFRSASLGNFELFSRSLSEPQYGTQPRRYVQRPAVNLQRPGSAEMGKSRSGAWQNGKCVKIK